MRPTIHFDYQPALGTEEIHNEPTYWMLTTKLEAIQVTIS